MITNGADAEMHKGNECVCVCVTCIPTITKWVILPYAWNKEKSNSKLYRKLLTRQRLPIVTTNSLWSSNLLCTATTKINCNISDPIDDISLRQNIVKWMCELDYEDCQRQSVEIFGQWMNSLDSYNPIDPALRTTVYCKVNWFSFLQNFKV